MSETPPKEEKTSKTPTVKTLASVFGPVFAIILIGAVASWWVKTNVSDDPHAGHDHGDHAHTDPVPTDYLDENSDVHPISLKIGSKIPDFALYEFKGEKDRFSELDGDIVLLNFWATWCAPCLIEIPSIIALSKKYEDRGLQVVLLNVDENPAEALPPYIDQLEIPFPVFVDQSQVATNLFDVSGLPKTVILRRETQEVLYELTGERDWNDSSVHKQMEKWLAE